MEIRDGIQGSISIEPHEYPVIDSRYFQRLRQIRQLGFAEHSFPGATHNRFIHSLGAMETATQAFSFLTRNLSKQIASLHPQTIACFRAALRFAALLHDIGHGPLSHTTEFAMPKRRELKLPFELSADENAKQATHEDYTLKIILDSSLTPILDAAGKSFGFSSREVAALISHEVPHNEDFFKDTIGGEKVDFFPLLSQLISSELDCDRMDYLRRDSYYTAVTYGEFDFKWMVSQLTAHLDQGKMKLAFSHRALYTFEDFLISRHHLFMMVYFHHKTVIYDEMLRQYLESPDCDYSLPANIETYASCTDAELYSHLEKSKNPWARRISEKRPLKVLIELHQGIPLSANENSGVHEKSLAIVKQELDSKKIPYLYNTSVGELAKSSSDSSKEIFVRYDDQYNPVRYLKLSECTNLIHQTEEKRAIHRIYVAPEDEARAREK